MSDDASIERRLAAVERALVAGEGSSGEGTDVVPEVGDLDAAAGVDESDLDPTFDRSSPGGIALERRVETLEGEVTGLDRRVSDLDAAVQALRGYVGSVRHVNRSVERRAEAALATAEWVGVDPSIDGSVDPSTDGPVDPSTDGPVDFD